LTKPIATMLVLCGASMMSFVGVLMRLIDRGLRVASVRRSFNTIKAIFNLAIAEHGLDMRNPFASIFMPEGDNNKRVSIPVDTIREIQQSCL